MRLSDFKILSFDCYGTLIDWEGGLLAALRPLMAKTSSVENAKAALERFAVFEAVQEHATPGKPYPAILAIVYKRLAESWNVSVPWDECLAFGQSIGDWPAFADSAAALAYLKGHFKLVILSNVDNASFARSNTRLGVEFDAIYTAEEIGSFKPDPRNFAYMLDNLALRGVAPGDILHTAQSLFHDHVPAAATGLARCWIDRRRGAAGGATPVPENAPAPDFRFDSLEALAAAHRTEIKNL